MGKIQRLRGYRMVAYYLPRRFQEPWQEASVRGYTPRDFFIAGLLLAHCGGKRRTISVRRLGQRYVLHVPDAVARTLQRRRRALRGLVEELRFDAGLDGGRGS